MITIDSIPSAVLAIDDFRMAHGAALADDLRDKVREIASAPSPVDSCVSMAELLYARRDDLPDAGRELGAALASFCAQNGWHGMLADNRGQQMMAVMLDAAGALPPGLAVPDVLPEPRGEYAAASLAQSVEVMPGMPPIAPTPSAQPEA